MRTAHVGVTGCGCAAATAAPALMMMMYRSKCAWCYRLAAGTVSCICAEYVCVFAKWRVAEHFCCRLLSSATGKHNRIMALHFADCWGSVAGIYTLESGHGGWVMGAKVSTSQLATSLPAGHKCACV